MLVISLTVAWTISGIRDRSRYHAALGDDWIEGEVGVYSSLAFWGGTLLAGCSPERSEDTPLFALIATLVIAGMIGLIVSALPITKLAGQRL